jgi:adenine-specific DNA glycosylase
VAAPGRGRDRGAARRGVPSDLGDLLALQGIGPYTARAIAAFAFGLRHPVVDTNTRRVIARAVLGQGEPGPPSTARDLAAMSALLPEADAAARTFNAAAMELGATVCTARSPSCDECPSPRRAPGAGPGTRPTKDRAGPGRRGSRDPTGRSAAS